MKDIDFDELDRAVSSVLNTTSSVPSPSDTVTPEVESAQPTPPDTTQVASVSRELSSPVSSASSEVAKPDTTQASPAVKRSGRFMDVMHPSADMRPAVVSAPSREGVSLSPIGDSERSEPANDEARVPDTEDEEVLDVSTPLQSPFLPDAQVDKRPLGGAPAVSNSDFNDLLAKELRDEYESTNDTIEQSQPVLVESNQSDEVVASTRENPDEQLPPTPEAASLPEELHTDLVEIESSEATMVPTQPQPYTPPVSETPLTPQNTSPVQGSIPQQYTEAPSTSDQSHVPIYDTEMAPQPLAHPAKKKSGWLVVVWIFLIIVLAVGGVLGLYFLGYL